MRQNIFRCICGAERVYGDTGENVTLSVRTVTTRPKLRCSNPDHPGIHWHEYLRSEISTWKDYKDSGLGLTASSSPETPLGASQDGRGRRLSGHAPRLKISEEQ